MRKSLARDWAGKAAGRVLRLGLGLLAGLALLTTTAASGTPPAATFSAAVNYTVGANPHGVAVGDFNKDGNLDLAVANQNSNSVTILFGKGDGTFGNAATVSIGTTSSGPIAIAVGDFNGDGNLDIVTANQGSLDVSVLLGNGNGTFQAAKSIPLGFSPGGLAVGDFNGDGKLDLAVTDFDFFNSIVVILLGNGDGTFQTPMTFPTGDGTFGFLPGAVIAADFGNGKLDLATSNSGDNTVSILLGKGDGTFAAASPVNVGSAPSGLAAGHFTGGTNLDLVVTNSGDNTVSVLLGDGKGGFTAASGLPVAVGLTPSAIVVGDFNGDGVLDFVTANVGNNDASLALGNGDGTFQPAVSLATHVNPVALAAGDFNGDKKLDLALANESSSDVSILLNTTVVTVVAPPPPPPPPPSNTPPTASAGPNQTITCTGPNGALVTLSGSGADTDGDTLSFTWLEGSNVLPNVTVVNNVATVTVLVSPGTHTFTLKVDDGHGNPPAMATTQVTVVADTTPPSLSVSLSPNVLWPPNKQLWTITAQVQASDNCTAHPSIALVSIWSNDPDDDKYDIKGASWGSDDRSFSLRARKADSGRERIYTVTYRAMDAAGNQAMASAQVIVPHSLGHHGLDDKHGKRRKGD